MHATGEAAMAWARRIARGPHWASILALVLGAGSLIEAFAYADPDDRPIAMVVGLCATVPLAVADRRPVLAAVAITASVFAMVSGVVTPSGSAVIALLIALYLVASRTRRRVAAPFAIPFLLNAIFPMAGRDAALSGLLMLVLVMAALALGDVQRLRRLAVAERDQSRAEAAATMEQRVAMAERARIARELHDVVAHHVSMIAVQAESTRLTTPGISEQGQARLADIASTAREALTEMRRLLGVLRRDADAGAELEPQPGLASLTELIDRARDAGAEVRFALSGEVTPLPSGVDRSAYRIVQEALTNARRHAPGATVDVELRYGDDALTIEVRDDGPGPADGWDTGHGLLGMRERATMAGGTVDAGPGAGRGFVVRAELPRTDPVDEVSA
jgi:signal transduction histidine kinase